MLEYGYKCTAGRGHLGVLVGQISLGTSGAVGTNTLPSATVTKTGTGTYDVTFASITKFAGGLASVVGEEKVAVAVDNANNKLTLTTYNTSDSAADLSDETINLVAFGFLGIDI